MIWKLLCMLFGHDERRLTKKERQDLATLAYRSSHIQGLAPDLSARQRVCRRCEATRMTRERKKRVAA